jgi:S-adenosylmethionine:tRNA ribosyltransferase-isomerase
VSSANAEQIQRARASGARVIAVGTTSVRVLETLARRPAPSSDYEGWADLFIAPPFDFRAVDAMITNFHLPRSSLLALVGAFAGLPETLAAYREAVKERYRFYSYGDAMLIL